MALDSTIHPMRIETSLLQRAILRTLAYADVFDYPLTVREIHRYLTGMRASLDEVSEALHHMDRDIARVGDYFMLCGRQAIVETRARRKPASKRLWKHAGLYGRILASLPFVRMVAVTGSLAMDNINDGGDIDYFIVTAPNRLWTCRAMSVLIVQLTKFAGANLCPNYFVSENALTLDHQSLYAAHEVTQMIPLHGNGIYDELRRLNRWTDEYLPNAEGAPGASAGEHLNSMNGGSSVVEERSRRVTFQSVVEFLLDLLPIQLFETWEKNRKIAKLSRGQNQNPEAVFSADVCKGHVNRHAQKIEDALAERFAKRAIGFD